MDLLDFLRLHDIAPHVFETFQPESVNNRANIKEGEGSGNFAHLVQSYRSEMVGVINDALNPASGFTNEIPPEINKQLHDGVSPTQANARMMGFVFGGIMEQFEDDYGSEDSLDEYEYQQAVKY